ncbi:hypothetical protein TruAng_011877 [Truncatella angustata]|nr:hypothetical protein TruAng_011877 [Truncatella angustata]
MNPVATDLDMHLTTFLKKVQSYAAVENFAVPMIISSFILDNYPPGMHSFRPKEAFNALYHVACRQVLTQWSSNRNGMPDFELPPNFLVLLEEEMIKHLCENCVQVFGQNAEDKPWVYLVPKCLLCEQDTNGAEVAMKPPTASVRVLSIDGGGTRGRAPLAFLQALQDRLQLPYLVQRNFDVIYGTSSGAIIAAVLFALDWNIEECTQYFEMFARVAFQPRWWWLRVPFLSAVLQMVASLLVDSRYSSRNLEEVLQKVLGTRSIMDCWCAATTGSKLGITVTTIRDARACVFTSYNGVGDRQDDTDYHVLNPQNGLSRIPLWEM